MKIISNDKIISIEAAQPVQQNNSRFALQFPKTGFFNGQKKPKEEVPIQQQLTQAQLAKLKAEWQAAKQTGDEAKKAKIKKILKGVGIGVGAAALAGAAGFGAYKLHNRNAQSGQGQDDSQDMNQQPPVEAGGSDSDTNSTPMEPVNETPPNEPQQAQTQAAPQETPVQPAPAPKPAPTAPAGPQKPADATGKLIQPSNGKYTTDQDVVQQNAKPGDWVIRSNGSTKTIWAGDINYSRQKVQGGGAAPAQPAPAPKPVDPSPANSGATTPDQVVNAPPPSNVATHEQRITSPDQVINAPPPSNVATHVQRPRTTPDQVVNAPPPSNVATHVQRVAESATVIAFDNGVKIVF